MTAPATFKQVEYVRIADAVRITGLSHRTLQEKAAAGLIPGARKRFGRWTFEVAALRRLGVSPCQKDGFRKISSNAAKSCGRGSRFAGSDTVSAYERALSQLRSAG